MNLPNIDPKKLYPLAVQSPTEPVARETNVGSVQVTTAIAGPQHPSEIITSEDTVQKLPPRLSWGAPTTGNWVQVGSEDKVRVGDVMRFTHKLRIPFAEEWQFDTMVSRFQNDNRFRLLYAGLNDESGLIVIEAQAVGTFTPVPLVAAAVVLILGAAFIWVTTISIERLGTIEVPGLPPMKVGGLIALGVVSVFILMAVGRVRGSA